MALCWLLAVSVAVVAARIPHDSEEYTTPRVIRATSRSFTIQVPCLTEETCTARALQYKKVNGSQWTSVQNIQKENLIHDLGKNSEYEISVEITYNSLHLSRKTKAWTCPEALPALNGIRAAKAGPGWLDVRWYPVEDQHCSSNIYYLVRYGVTGAKMTEWMSYGVFNRSNGGEEVFRPTHPCAAWDAEFCLLLTDDVMPGGNHSVQVKPLRYSRPQWPSGEGSEVGSEVTLSGVLADPKVTGEYALGARDPLTPCERRGRVLLPPHGPGGGSGEDRSLTQQRVVVPIWAIVVASLLLVGAVVLFVVARCRQRSASSKQLLSEESVAAGSAAVDPPGHRCSSVYDDCLTTVHMGHPSLPEPAPPPRCPEPLNDRLKGMPQARQGATPSKLQELKEVAVAAAAKVSGEPELAPAANHYVAMAAGQPVYDDAQGLVHATPQHTYSNFPGDGRESNLYIEPGSPIYEDTKAMGLRESEVSTGYNRPYSHAKEGPWRAW